MMTSTEESMQHKPKISCPRRGIARTGVLNFSTFDGKKAILAAIYCALSIIPLKAEQNTTISKHPAMERYSGTDARGKHLVLDISTPELSVLSWWQYLDLRADFEFARCIKYSETEDPSHLEFLMTVASGNALNSRIKFANDCIKEVFERKILEIKMDGPNKAEVYASIWNITPIPVGATPNEDQVITRKKGKKFKYALEKGSEGWKVFQVYWFHDAFEEDTTGINPWFDLYSIPGTVYYPSMVIHQ